MLGLIVGVSGCQFAGQTENIKIMTHEAQTNESDTYFLNTNFCDTIYFGL